MARGKSVGVPKSIKSMKYSLVFFRFSTLSLSPQTGKCPKVVVARLQASGGTSRVLESHHVLPLVLHRSTGIACLGDRADVGYLMLA